MAFAAATCTPSSLQLRLALCSSNRRRSYAGHLRPAPVRRKPNSGIGRITCVSRKREDGAWNGSDSPADSLAGWSDSSHGEKSSESHNKSWIPGVVGAGVAGIILVAGLGYAASSLSKHDASRLKQRMQTLTTQQETGLLSADETPSDESKLDRSEVNNVKHENGSIKASGDTVRDLLSSECEGDVGEKKTILGTEISAMGGIEHTSAGTDFTDSITAQDKLETYLVVQSDLETAWNEKDLSESKALLDSSTEPNLRDSERSSPADLDKQTSEDQGSILNVEQTKVSNSENYDAKQVDYSPFSSCDVNAYATAGTAVVNILDGSQSDSYSESLLETKEFPDVNDAPKDLSSIEVDAVKENDYSENPVPESANPFENQLNTSNQVENTRGNLSSSAGIPAPSAAIQVNPGKILVPAAVDQVQYQSLAALQVLKVIERDAQPSDLCTRREYARWLVSASSALSRNTLSKVYPAMYIENVTELAFDDVTPDDPDFSSIQGLAESGLIESKLSSRDLLHEVEGPFLFYPERLLSRQDLISWKMALEKQQLPEADKKVLYKLSGFIDIDKINPEAWPALIADLSSREEGIAALAFGCTRLFQPDKPVTKAQASLALAIGEASDVVSEELARIEAESMAENAVSAHNALVAQVEKDVNASFEKQLSMEKEKIDAVEKMAEQARSELAQMRAQREEENLGLLKERAMIESEMEVLSRLRREVEEQLQSLMSDKAEISYEKERLNILRKDAEDENQRISKLQYELEVERKALTMARSWAEDEAKRAREQARALEEARRRWETKGLKVVVDEDLQDESSSMAEQPTWLNAKKQFSLEETENRARILVEKLKAMAVNVGGKSQEAIDMIIKKIRYWVLVLKEWILKAGRRAGETSQATIFRAKGSVEALQRGTVEVSSAMKNGVVRVVEDCREGVGKISQKFKT